MNYPSIRYDKTMGRKYTKHYVYVENTMPFIAEILKIQLMSMYLTFHETYSSYLNHIQIFILIKICSLTIIVHHHAEEVTVERNGALDVYVCTMYMSHQMDTLYIHGYYPCMYMVYVTNRR